MSLGLEGVDLSDTDAQGRVLCPDCGERFTKRGMTTHRKSHVVVDALRERTAEDIVREVRLWGYGLLRSVPEPEIDQIIKSKGHDGDPNVWLSEVRNAFAVKVLEMTDR